MMADDGVEGEAVGLGEGLPVEGLLGLSGQEQVAGEDDAVFCFEERGFKDAGEFADVAGPVVLKEAGEGARPEEDRALLIASADAVEQGLGEGRDVFAALAERRNGKADGGEAEGEVREKEALSGHLAERCLR